MPGMTPALFQAMTQHLASIAALLSGLDGELTAETAAMKAAVVATGDIALIHAVYPVRTTFDADLFGTSLCKSLLYRQMQNLTAPIRNAGLPLVNDPASFAAYYNTGAGGPYQCLLSEGFAAAYELVVGISLRAADIAPKPVPNLGKRSVGGIFKAGQSINSSLYAGATAIASVSESAFTPSRAAGAGRLTAIGDARDKSGSLVPSREFTAILSGDGDAHLDPTEAGDLLLHVSSITLPPNMTAGTVTLKSL